MKAAVVAGTPVDTRMGVDFLKGKDSEIETFTLPMFANPRECHLFQMSDHDNKIAVTEEKFREAVEMGFSDFFIYCNSLSSSVDYRTVAERTGLHLVTPETAYCSLAKEYSSLAVICANSQATRWIEDVFNAVNPQGYVCGVGLLRIVEAVEKKISPEELVDSFGLDRLCRFFEKAGCEAVALGCTHYPYFADALRKVTDLPVLDPADIMYEELIH